MNPSSKSLLTAFVLAATLCVSRASADDAKPYKVGSSYLIVFAPVAAKTVTEVPEGPCTIVEQAGDWIKIEFSTSKPERSKSDPGTVTNKETRHKAWINLDYVVALMEP